MCSVPDFCLLQLQMCQGKELAQVNLTAAPGMTNRSGVSPVGAFG